MSRPATLLGTAQAHGAGVLIDRLEGARRTGAGRWLAKCPAHADRKASLSVRELDDGRVLFHCFAGCEAEAVLNAAGLQWSDVLPPRQIDHHRQPERVPFHALDVLRALELEALIVAGLAAAMGMGVMPSDDDRKRVSLAHTRILAGLHLAGGGE